MNKKSTRVTVIIICLIIIVVGYYAYLSNRSRVGREEEVMTFVQSTLSRDLENNYPPTPKEVIKYYNEILRCLYNEESTDEEIEDLGLKARELYDADLLENNELGSYLLQLRADVQSYRDNQRKFTNFNVASSTNVTFFEKDGASYAKIMCGYNLLQGTQNLSTNQIYILRKDENKRWKIYGWQDANNEQK